MIVRTSRKTAAVLIAALVAPMAARADNQMGYRLETPQLAAALPRGGGSLGMKVGPEKEITSGGMTFEILKVESVGQNSPARQAGLAVGDQVIAVDGRVFPDSKTFAEYVESVAPGYRIEVDYARGRRPQAGSACRRYRRRGRPGVIDDRNLTACKLQPSS